jgi:hypothetical protein
MDGDSRMNENKFKPEWGFQNLMVIAAFRYCLGRRTYIVGSCVDWLKSYWDELDENSKIIIIREIQECLFHKLGGDECDVSDWESLLKFAEEKK